MKFLLRVYVLLFAVLTVTQASAELGADIIEKLDSQNSASAAIIKQSFPGWKFIRKFWNYPIVSMDQQQISASNIIIAIILIIIGIRVSKYVSSVVRGKLLVRILPLEENMAYVVEKVFYYIMLIFTSFMVLDIANIPFTMFAFIGGALAIGIGVGGQNIVNNFISGIVIIIERPFTVGDVVEMDDLLMNVINIGARSTHFRTNSNVDIFMPNSVVLDHKIINWSFSGDGSVRIASNISFTADNAPDDIEKALLSAFYDNRHIIHEPAPRCFLVSFDNGVLNYELQFWIDILSDMNRKAILNSIYTDIYDAIKTLGIKPALPQHVLYLKQS